MTAPARRAAYEALRAIESGRALLAEAIVASREPLQDDRDRALVTSIVTGTLRWRNRLDFVLSRHVMRELARLDPEVLEILRLSVYQLLFLARVPASAVVHDAVNLTRAAGKTSAAGFVNAVLRKVSRTRDRLDFPQAPSAGAAGTREAWLDALSLTGSHPRWLVERWLDRMGPEAAAAWVEFNNEEPALTIRANTLKTSRELLGERLLDAGVETGRLRFAPDGLRVLRGNPLRTPLAKQGLFVVQDEASQLVALMCGRQQRWRTLDACAAPGGKTLVLASGPARGGLLVAADRRWRRLKLLREYLATAGAGQARIVALDLRPAPHSGTSSISCSWTPRAPASARCGGRSTSGGAARRAMSERRRRSRRGCCAMRRAWWPLAAGWSTPPVPASRKRTRGCSRRGSAANRASARPTRSCCRAKASRPGCSTSRAICTPARIYMAWKPFSPRRPTAPVPADGPRVVH